jgi:hypothetical protein
MYIHDTTFAMSGLIYTTLKSICPFKRLYRASLEVFTESFLALAMHTHDLVNFNE